MPEVRVTITSSPEGVPVSVNGAWKVTPYVEAFPSGSTLVVRILTTAKANDKQYFFRSWFKNNVKVSDSATISVTVTEDTTLLAQFEELPYIPVRHPAARASKYDGKVVADIYEKRIDTLKPLMVEEYRIKAEEQESLDREVGDYLNKLGLTPIDIRIYRMVAQELYGLRNKYTGETLNKAATISAKRWITEGLRRDIISEIARRLGITLYIE